MAENSTADVKLAVLVSALFDPQFYRVRIDARVAGDYYLSLFSSYDQAATWRPVRGATFIRSNVHLITLFDWEVPLNSPSACYKSRVFQRAGESFNPVGDYSNVIEASPTPRGVNWWLK